MGTKLVMAVMHCTRKEFRKIIDLIFKIVATMYEHATEYATPPRPVVEMQKKAEEAESAQSLVKKGGIMARTKRDALTNEIFDILESEFLPYVNKLYKGQPDMLSLSGFDLSKDPAPVGTPATPVINRVAKGPVPGSVKIYLEKSAGPLNEKKYSRTYFVWMGDSPVDDTRLRQVLTTTNSRELIVLNVPFDVPMYYCVSSHHGKIGTNLSTKVKFTLS